MELIAGSPRLRLGLTVAEGKPAADRYNDEAPLAFGYFAAYLRRHAPWCEVLFRFTVEELLAEGVDVIGISASTNHFMLAREWAAKIKAACGLPVIMGGVHLSVCPQSLTPDMDVAVLGEGEETLLELLECFRAHGKRPPAAALRAVAGLAYWEEGRVVQSASRPPIRDLDGLPHPERRTIWIGHPAARATLFSSRGCPYRCTFCASSRFWPGLRQFGAEYVVREIEAIHAEWGLRQIHFFDDLFIHPLRRLERICELLEERGLTREILFSGAVRANLVSERLCELLVRMNVREVMFGAESFAPRVLAYLKCGTADVADNHRAIALLRRHGILVNLSMIHGTPVESAEEMEQTFAALEEYLASGAIQKWGQGVLLPYLGTPVWDEARRRGLVSDDMDWDRIRCHRGTYLGGVPEAEFHRRWQAHRQRCMLLAPGQAALWREWGMNLGPAEAVEKALMEAPRIGGVLAPPVDPAAAGAGNGASHELETWRSLLRSQGAAERPVAAIRAAREILARAPDDAETRAVLCAYYRGRGEGAAAARMAPGGAGPADDGEGAMAVGAAPRMAAMAEERAGQGGRPGTVGGRIGAAESAADLLRRGIALVEGGALPAAIPFFERAVEVEPRGEHWGNLAVAYARAGREADAAAAFQEALQRAPGDVILREDAQAFYRGRRRREPRARTGGVGRAADGPEIGQLREMAVAFEQELGEQKRRLKPPEFWYPFGTLSNFVHLDRLLSGEHRRLLSLTEGRPIADIGAADGDLAFFLESLGVEGAILDYGPTNFNGLMGARLLAEARRSRVEVHEVDLDSQFALPRHDYGLVFLLGILYHLQNPYYVLRRLAEATRFLLLSTRTTVFAADRRQQLAGAAVAYLLDADESFNHDASNYWIFTEAGLQRILARTGWLVREWLSVGDTRSADPASQEGDMRTFALLESRRTR